MGRRFGDGWMDGLVIVVGGWARRQGYKKMQDWIALVMVMVTRFHLITIDKEKTRK